jgi:cellobiose transport system permease protein
MSTEAGSRRSKPQEGGQKVFRAKPLTYAALTFGVILSLFPLYWMIVIASRTNDAINDLPPKLTPGGNLGENIQRVLDNPQAHFAEGILNSLIVSGVVTLTTVLFGSLAGFAFAKLRFRGKNAFLLIILATMMVPVQLGVIPLFNLMAKLGWVGEIESVIAPFMVTGFAVFMMRQYAQEAIPDELIEAARVDGCHTLRIYWNVVLPALRPAAAVLGLLTFMQTWNEFFWPFIVLGQSENPTVQVSLKSLNNMYYADYTQIFAGTVLSTIPLLIVFVLFGKQIIGGIMEGAVKA